MNHIISPAEYVISVFQGVRKTARILKVNPAAVSRWRKNGIPRTHFLKILSIAEEKGLDITPDDLILGRKTKTKR